MKLWLTFFGVLLMTSLAGKDSTAYELTADKKETYELKVNHLVEFTKDDLKKTEKGHSHLVGQLGYVIGLDKAKVSSGKVTFRAIFKNITLDFDIKHHVTNEQDKQSIKIGPENLKKQEPFELTIRDNGQIDVKKFKTKQFKRLVLNPEEYSRMALFGLDYFNSKSLSSVLSQAIIDFKFADPESVNRDQKLRFAPVIRLPEEFAKQVGTFADWWQLKDLIGGLQGYREPTFKGIVGEEGQQTLVIEDDCGNTFVDQWGMWTVKGHYEMVTKINKDRFLDSGVIEMTIVEDVTDTLSGVGNGQFNLKVRLEVDFDIYEKVLEARGGRYEVK